MLTFRTFPFTAFDGDGGGGGGGGNPNPPPAPQPTPPANPPAPQPTPGGGRAEDRIAAALTAKAEAERQAAAEKKRADDLEAKSASEAERERKRADKAEQRANELEATVQAGVRKGWAEEAAKAEGFRSTEDVVLRLDLAELDSEAKVKAEVKKLSDREDLAYLKGQGQQPPPAGFGHLGTPPPDNGDVPKDADGKEDVKLGLGRDLLGALTGRPK